MANPYEPPREGSEAQAVSARQISGQPIRQSGYTIAVLLLTTSAALVIGIMMLSGSSHPAALGVAAGLALVHSAAWAVFGFFRYGWLGFFAFGVGAFAAFVLLDFAIWVLVIAVGSDL